MTLMTVTIQTTVILPLYKQVTVFLSQVSLADYFLSSKTLFHIATLDMQMLVCEIYNQWRNKKSNTNKKIFHCFKVILKTS